MNTESPSQAILASASKTVKVTDARGRTIEVRKLKMLDRMRLLELVGAANAENQQYLGFAVLAYSVLSINGNPLGRPSTKLALEGIVQELDDDGFEAVSKAFSEHFMSEADTDDTMRDAVKNG